MTTPETDHAANMMIPVTAPDGTKGEIHIRIKGGRTVEEWIRDVVAPEALGLMVRDGLTAMHRGEN